MLSRLLAFAVLALSFATAAAAQGDPAAIRGGWEARTYEMKGGVATYEIKGQILFTEKNFTVLFFTMKDGKVIRASGEGGSYETDGKNLTFYHRYFVGPAFPATPGLKAQAAEATIHSTPHAEPITFVIDGDNLTFHMGPSGNTLTWVRLSK